MSLACDLTSTTYQACTITGGVRTTTGASASVVLQNPDPQTLVW